MVIQFAVHEVDGGVLTVLALLELERLAAVAAEGDVLPGRKQWLLLIESAYASHDQSVTAEDGPGDLRLARVRAAGERLPRLQKVAIVLADCAATVP